MPCTILPHTISCKKALFSTPGTFWYDLRNIRKISVKIFIIFFKEDKDGIEMNSFIQK